MANEIVISGTKKEILWAISEMGFEPDTIYVFKGAPQGTKYTLNALNYCWQLMDKIAKHPSIKSTKQEVYMSMLEKVGERVYLPVLPQNVDTLQPIFRIIHDRGEVEMTTASGKKVVCRQLECLKGISAYDSREMAKFIDEVVHDCKVLGIETETPDELERIKATWGEK